MARIIKKERNSKARSLTVYLGPDLMAGVRRNGDIDWQAMFKAFVTEALEEIEKAK